MLSTSKSHRAALACAAIFMIIGTIWLWGAERVSTMSPRPTKQTFHLASTADQPLWGGRYAPATRARLGLPQLDFLDSTSVERHRPQPRFPDNLHERGTLGQRARDYHSPWVQNADVLIKHARRHRLLLEADHGRPLRLRADAAAAAGRDQRPTRVVIATNEVMGVGYSGGVGTEVIETVRALFESPWPFHVTVLYSMPCNDEEGQLGMREKIAALVDELGEQRFSFVCLRETQEWKTWKPLIHPTPVDYWPMLEVQVVYFWLRAREASVDVVHTADFGGLTAMAVQARRQGLAFANIIFITYLHGQMDWATIASGLPPVSKYNLFQALTTTWTVEGADIIQALNSYMGEAILRRGFAVKAPLIVAAPNAFSEASEAKLRRNAPGPPRRKAAAAEEHSSQNSGAAPHAQEQCKEIVFFGRLESRKGWRTLLGAVNALAQDYASGARKPPKHRILVSFVGKPLYNEPDEIREVWKIGSIESYFDLHLETKMARDDYLAYLRQPGRVVVVPSLTENMPYTVIEPLLAGAHVLAANVGGIPDLLDHVESGALVSSTVRGWTEALGRCIEDGLGQRPRLAYNMSEARLAGVLLHARAAELVGEQDASEFRGHARLARPVPPEPSDMVSICIASHNRADTLDATLGSLVQQTFPNIEVIVFDDASRREERMKIGKTFDKWRLSPSGRKLAGWQLVDPPGGKGVWLGAARRLCAGHASKRSQWLMFMDDDDLLDPRYIESMLRAVHSYPADMASTSHAMFEGYDGSGRLITTVKQARASMSLLWMFFGTAALMTSIGGENNLGSSNIFIRKSTYWRLGGHSVMEDVIGEDYGLWVRAATYGVEGTVLPEPLYLRRVGGTARMSAQLEGSQAIALGGADNMETLVHSMAGLIDSGALGPLNMMPFVMSRWYGRWQKKDAEGVDSACNCKPQAVAAADASASTSTGARWGTFPNNGWVVGMAVETVPRKSLQVQPLALGQCLAQIGKALQSGKAQGMVWHDESNVWRQPPHILQQSRDDQGQRLAMANGPYVSPDGRIVPAVEEHRPGGKRATGTSSGTNVNEAQVDVMAPYLLWSGASTKSSENADKPSKRLRVTARMTGDSCDDGDGVRVLIVLPARKSTTTDTKAPASSRSEDKSMFETDPTDTIRTISQFVVSSAQKAVILTAEVDVGEGPVAVMIDPQGEDTCDSVHIDVSFG